VAGALAFILLALTAAPVLAAERPLVVLVSIDGFRADYLYRGVTPVLSRLAAEGASAAMRPSFPTKTFPNHYTLVTGRRPDRNGIVSNNILDPDKPGVTFGMGNRDAVQDGAWWNQAEPIWITAERAGLVTAPVFWPGSEAPIHGLRPRHWRPFDMSVPSEARVDNALALLDAPAAQRPAFLTVYFDVVDTAGHRLGPDGPAVHPALQEADAAMGRLLAGLTSRGVVANLIIVADHGMAQVAPERRISIDDILAKGSYRTTDLGSFGSIWPQPGHEAAVTRALTAKRPHLQCWEKAKVPARLRYGRHPRVAPIVCMPQTGWTLTTRDYAPKDGPGKGEHGYDNASAEMAAIFIAHGPAFRAGVRLRTFDNVSVYPLLGKLLNVAPQRHDGSLRDVAKALR